MTQLHTLNKSVIICILSSLLFAAPLLAEEEPYPRRSVKGLFELDLFTQVLSRRVVEEDPFTGDNIEGDADSTRVMARLRVKPVKPLELYVQGGAANLNIDDFGYSGDYSFAYGGGFNLTLYEEPGFNRFRLMLSGDALTFTTNDRVIVTFCDPLGVCVDVPGVKEEIRWLEYSISGTGTWRVEYWEPYIGLRFSWLDSTDNVKDPSVGKLDLEEDNNVGILAGANFFLDTKENIALNLEGTLIDQASFKIGLKLWY